MEGIDTDNNDGRLFENWSIKRMYSSMVPAQLNLLLGKAVGHIEERPRISVTLVGKSVVRKVSMQKPKSGKDFG